VVSALPSTSSPVAGVDRLQTDLGLLPSDWDAPSLNELIQATQLGGNYQNSERETPWPLIKMGNMARGSVSLSKMEYVVSTTPPNPRDRLRRGDVIFNTRNTLDLVGKVCIWNEELPEAYFNSNIMRLSFWAEHVASQRYMNYVLNSERVISALRGIATGTTSVAAIYYRDLAKVSIPLPPKKEQRAIAEALSDADALIESLESLIAKKRAIKQGAMQELLSGRRRLPGFSKQWEAKKIGDVLSIMHGKSQHNVASSDGLYPILATGGQIGTAKSYLYDKPSVLIGRKGTIDRPQYVEAPFWTVDTLFYSVMKGNNSAKFFFYRFCLIDWRAHNEASGVPSLNSRTIEKIELKVPDPDEQMAIVRVLSDMDDDIDCMERRLSKSRQIKQGMMQELLTGRVRLL
jgi:type I restriction enzyme, S subunit